jgi:hypothetical protein
MKSPIIIKENVQVDLAEEVMNFGLKTAIAIVGIIGLLAFCGLVAALLNVGPLAMARGYITAITGM